MTQVLPPGPPGPLSLRAYAARRKALGLPGGSHQAVLRAMASERLKASLTADRAAIADPELADREWAANTDHSKAPADVKERAAGQADPPAGDDAAADQAGEGPNLSQASAREKHYKALLAELTYLQRAGQLVKAAEVEAEIAELLALVRTKLLGLPSKAKQLLPHLTHQDLATLDAIVREALEVLSRADAEAAA